MSTSVPYWGDDPKAWDQCKFNKQLVPGIVKVTYQVPKRLDVRKPPKAHYAVLVDQGKPPFEGTIKITLGFHATAGQPYDDGSMQWDRWLALEQALWGKKASVRNAIAVSHPEFARKGISHVYMDEPGPLEGEGPGTRTITIAWYQNAKIVPAGAGEVKAPAPKKDVSISSLKKAPKPSSTETKAP